MGTEMEEQQSWLEALERIEPGAVDSTPIEREALVEPVASAPLPANHVRGTTFDSYLFDEALAQTPLGKAVQDGAGRGWVPTPELAQDLRNAFLKHQPERQEVAEGYQKNAEALDTAMDLPEFEKMRTLTTADEFNSCLAAAQFTQTLVEELLKQQEQEQQEKEEEPEEEEEPPEALESEEGNAPGGSQPGQPGGNGMSKEEQEARAARAAAKQATEAKKQQRKQQQQLGMRVAARKAAGAAEKSVKQSQALLTAFGGGEDEIGGGWGTGSGSEGQHGTIAERVQLALAAAQNPRIAKIAEVAGRLRMVAAAAQRERVDKIPAEIAGVTQGRDIPHVLPSDLAYLAMPELEDLFWLKYMQGQLRQYQFSGTEKLGRGPIIFCADESGSMSGEHADWAAGIGLALLSIAAKQGRDFVWIHFGGRGEIKAEEYTKGKGVPGQVMASALHFFNGGTDYDGPLMLALTALEIEHGQFNKGDVIFVTDAICQVSSELLEQWLRVKKQKQFSCYGLLVGDYSPDALKVFCDAVVNVTPNENDQGPLTMAFSV